MVLLLKMPVKPRKVSKTRNKSLILNIPATARDLLEITSESELILEVWLENENKYIKLYEKKE